MRSDARWQDSGGSDRGLRSLSKLVGAGVGIALPMGTPGNTLRVVIRRFQHCVSDWSHVVGAVLQKSSLHPTPHARNSRGGCIKQASNQVGSAEGTASLERRDNALLTANATPISDEERYRLSDFSQRGEIDALVEAVDELRARPIDERRHIAVEAEEARIRRRC